MSSVDLMPLSSDPSNCVYAPTSGGGGRPQGGGGVHDALSSMLSGGKPTSSINSTALANSTIASAPIRSGSSSNPPASMNNYINHNSNATGAPPVEIKLFVGRVPRTFDEAMLRPIFDDFGSVGDVIIIRDRDTGAHKGCAFVRMASITKADLAIRSLNNTKVLDQSLGPLQVKYAAGEVERLGLPSDTTSPGQDQAKLFVGSLPKGGTEEDIKNVFGRFGQIDEVFLMKDDNKQSKGRSGCAFVKFTYKEEAFHAIANLNGKFTMNGSSRAMEVRFAENKKAQAQQQLHSQLQTRVGQTANHWTEYFTNDMRPYYYNAITGHTQWERPPEMDVVLTPVRSNTNPSVNSAVAVGAAGAQTHGPPGANVFVFHIPNEWTEHEMLTNFACYGQIVSARIASDKTSGRNRGFGFISFADVAAAVAAVQGMNGFSVNGKRLKVQIKKGEERFAENYLIQPQTASSSVMSLAANGSNSLAALHQQTCGSIGGLSSNAAAINAALASGALGGNIGGGAHHSAAVSHNAHMRQHAAALQQVAAAAQQQQQQQQQLQPAAAHLSAAQAAVGLSPGYPSNHSAVAAAAAAAVMNPVGAAVGSSSNSCAHTLAQMTAAQYLAHQ